LINEILLKENCMNLEPVIQSTFYGNFDAKPFQEKALHKRPIDESNEITAQPSETDNVIKKVKIIADRTYQSAHEVFSQNVLSGFSSVQIQNFFLFEESDPHPVSAQELHHIKIGEEASLLSEEGKYEGDLVNGKAHGKGTYIWPNGDKYVGDFVDGKKQGRGIFTYISGDKYEGDFFEDYPSGNATIAFANGDKYEGAVVDIRPHGKGVLVWANGDKYEGDFINGKRWGKGVLIRANKIKYEGDFFDDKRMGKGTITWVNGDVYEGNFMGGRRVGKGTFTLSNGTKYVGDYVYDKKTGKGSLIPNDNDNTENLLFEALFNGKI
jgi:hypothetical protein